MPRAKKGGRGPYRREYRHEVICRGFSTGLPPSVEARQSMTRSGPSTPTADAVADARVSPPGGGHGSIGLVPSAVERHIAIDAPVHPIDDARHVVPEPDRMHAERLERRVHRPIAVRDACRQVVRLQAGGVGDAGAQPDVRFARRHREARDDAGARIDRRVAEQVVHPCRGIGLEGTDRAACGWTRTRESPSRHLGMASGGHVT